MADPKILYWVSGIVVALLVAWVGFVNLRLESRTAPAGPKKPEPKEDDDDEAEEDEAEEDEAEEEAKEEPESDDDAK